MVVRVEHLQYRPDYDVVPQAIFWRPLQYFTTLIRQGEDDLDSFDAASFIIGNRERYDLRRYRGHPAFTVTLYLPFKMENLKDITLIISHVVEEMAVPPQALAWRRGQEYRPGHLDRPTRDRLREREARVLALKIAAKCPNRTATTEFIKDNVPDYVELSEQDLLPSETRPREQRWQQIVGNVISHRETPRGPFQMGYATRTDDGLAVTEEGVAYLNNMGFSV